MVLPKEPDIHIPLIQLMDQQASQTPSPLYLTIQDQLAHLILQRRPYPHLSLKPFSGN